MVVVIPLETAYRLVEIARTHRLDISLPLSSSCASYLAPEQLETIVSTVSPLAHQHPEIAQLLQNLQAYRQTSRLPAPCP